MCTRQGPCSAAVYETLRLNLTKDLGTQSAKIKFVSIFQQILNMQVFVKCLQHCHKTDTDQTNVTMIVRIKISRIGKRG